MKNKLVVINPTKSVIQLSKWNKKDLADFHIEMTGLCGFGCRYCSSNSSLWMQFNKHSLSAATLVQTGETLTPTDNPELAYVWSEPVAPRLAEELARKRKSFGAGKVVALSQMTDCFAPAVDQDDLEAVLTVLMEKTSLRVRILTKSTTVASERWLKFLKAMGQRVVVSLSIGSLDNEWSGNVEIGTSNPVARLNALRKLQDEGIPTFAMLCPVFPQVMESGRLNDLIDAVRPEKCEYVWAEPYNDRQNWKAVRDGHPLGSAEYEWFDRCFGPNKDPDLWSDYATKLYKQLWLRAYNDSWTDKLKYMLYELSIRPRHVSQFWNLRGVLLQCVDKIGKSKNPEFAKLQETCKVTRYDRLRYEVPVANPAPNFLRLAIKLRHKATGTVMTVVDGGEAPEILGSDDVENIDDGELVNACLYALHIWEDGVFKPELISPFQELINVA